MFFLIVWQHFPVHSHTVYRDNAFPPVWSLCDITEGSFPQVSEALEVTDGVSSSARQNISGIQREINWSKT